MTDGAAEGVAVWARISDGLIDGIHHALNNRLAALSAVAQVLAAEIPAEHPLQQVLKQEVERMRDTVDLLALLPASAEEEPVQPGDVVEQALSLFRLHHDLRDVPVEVETAPGLLPLWTRPAQLTHLVVVMLALAGRAAAAAQDEGRLRVGCTGDGAHVRIEVETKRAAREEGRGEMEPVDPGALADLARAVGGELEGLPGHDPGARYAVRLPTLPEVRRRERAAAGS